MSRLEDRDGENFYIYAMELFSKAGHVFTSVPEIINHSPEQFCYFDNKSDIVLSQDQRAMFQSFNNVSRLFSYNRCVFLSLNLLTTKRNRSQMAHDIHMMLHPIIGMDGTICLFRYDNEVMLTFTGFGYRCILSDWYPAQDDDGQLLDRLDISNISIEWGADYFADMVYMLARKYYHHLYGRPSTYDILPIDFVSSAEIDGIDREKLDEFIEFVLTGPQREYGDDYIEYDEHITDKGKNTSIQLDLMLLEIDEEFASEDKFFDDNTENSEKDIYEFENIDSELFRDPTLMVKWLNEMEQKDLAEINL